MVSLVELLNRREGWGLAAAECRALGRALEPWLDSAGDLPDPVLELIIINFYHDGPVVMQIRDAALSEQNEQVVQQWRDYTASVARARFHLDPAMLDDVLQDTWVDALRALRQRKFHFRARFSTYLFSLVIHRTLNTLRKESRATGGSRMHAIPYDEADAELAPLASGTWEAEVEAIENSGLVELVLEALERYRSKLSNSQISPQVKIQLARLVLLQGDNLKEAAEKLALNYDTAVTILRRVREYLKHLPELQDYRDD